LIGPRPGTKRNSSQAGVRPGGPRQCLGRQPDALDLFGQLLAQAGNGIAQILRQPLVARMILAESADRLLQAMMSLWHDDTEFGQDAAQLVAGLHHLLDLQQAHPHQGLDCLADSLFTRTARTWVRGGFGHSVGIAAFVLVRPLAVGFDRLGRHHLHPEAEIAEKPPPSNGRRRTPRTRPGNAVLASP
jgi:hypothetical protein